MSKIITVDGPSASGKSTVAKAVAARLGCIYVDSGAVYRAVTWNALRQGIDPRDHDKVVESLRRARLEFALVAGSAHATVDGLDPGSKIRSGPVNEAVSEVSAIPEVRDEVGRRLRDTARLGDIVMDGRDIGSVVFPDATHKFYLDASPEERARRRQAELAGGGEAAEVKEVLDSLSRRDRKDSTRAAAPLTVPQGAAVIDTTRLTIEQVADAVLARIRE